MSGIFWHFFTFGIVAVSLLVLVYRTLAIIKLPVHLRWELMPIPHDKTRARYGGSHLEEGEYWNRPRRRSCIAPLIYISKEIFFLRAVWKHNRGLWPLSLSFHTGIYLLVGALVLSLINAFIIKLELSAQSADVISMIISIISLAGYLMGGLGSLGLIVKRLLDPNLRTFNSRVTYFNLVFLAAVFVSGFLAWLASDDIGSSLSTFFNGLVSLNSGLVVTEPLSLHLIILLLFMLYLPFTSLIHFIAKYFLYHAVRWNDEPLDDKMRVKIERLKVLQFSWSAPHVKTDSRTDWAGLSTEKQNELKKT